MKIIKRILLALLLLIIVFLVVVALQPSQYSVSRSAVIAAPPSDVFAQVNDFHNWEAWSPWAKLDPSAKNSFDGAPAGTGAGFAWSGNDKVGEGRMTITDSKPPELVRIKLDFVKPFASTANTLFEFKPEGDQTRVTWTMSGDKNFMSKAVCMSMNMDKMIGGDFERGLASLKAVAEALSRK